MKKISFKGFIGFKKANDSDRENEVQSNHFDEHEYESDVVKPSRLNEAVEEDSSSNKRIVVKSDSGKARGTGATSVNVPKHMWSGSGGMEERNKARAKVYGDEHREPLPIGQVSKTHQELLKAHFAKPKEEQIKDEEAAVARLRKAKHLSKDGGTTSESDKTDSIRYEKDEAGRNYEASAVKMVAGHAVYTSGDGENQKHHIINTCPGQTKGCGGGVSSEGGADVRRGACFAHNSESQYKNAARSRASNTQAMHDPAMTKDWCLAHTHSIRNDAETSDKAGARHVVRPNTLAENDESTRHVLKHLNKQRKGEGKPSIISYQYSKTNALNDPKNDHHVTYSNTGPKVKNGMTISENVGRDKSRVRQTITSTDSNGDKIKNEEGHEVPAKHSYVVHNLRRGSDEEKDFATHVKSARYWDAGTKEHDQTEEDKKLPSEGHYDEHGNSTTPDQAHHGHMKVNGTLYKYHRQHVLHGLHRTVDVDGHATPSDARFKDDEYLPKDKERFKSKRGVHGAIVATSPTLSTNLEKSDNTEFTHNVHGVAEKAKHNGGIWDIDHPHDQEAAKGKEFAPVQKVDVSGLKRKKK